MHTTSCVKEAKLVWERGTVYFSGVQDRKDECEANSMEESGMVGEDADGDSREDCQFRSVGKSFWRSASWSSHSTPSSPGPVNCGKAQPSAQTRNRHTDSFQVPPVPLTPRLQQTNKARSSLPPLQPLSITRRNLEEWPKAGSDDIGEWPNPPTPGSRRDAGKLRNGPDIRLDLGSVHRNIEPTELQLKRDKFAFFDKKCSRVAEHIYLGSDAVARNRDVLRENDITHVLNCVGFVCPEYFKEDLVYKTLWLQDSPCEDITSILYDVFDYFEEVRDHGGRVLVHCCQGVSRSTSLVIAYLMWRKGQSFEDAFQYVKAARGITNPNMGFACQLLQCQKRVHAAPMSPSSVLRMYRMAPHSPYDPLHLVPKTLNDPGANALDSRGAFVVHIPCAIYVWIGQHCEPAMVREANAAASQVVRYERAQGPIVTIQEGNETHEFWDALSKAPLSLDDSEKTGKGIREEEILEAWHSGKEQVEAALRLGVGNKRVEAYDIDFELFRRAIVGGVVPPFPLSGAGAETHLPARENGWGILRRKFVSGSMKELVTASKATGNIKVSESGAQKEAEFSNQDEQLLSPDPLTSSSSPYLSPSSLFSDSNVSSKSPSPSPSSLSFTPSPSSSPWSLFSSSQSPSPVSNLLESFVGSNSPSQTVGMPVSFPSKGSPLSLAQRRGSNSQSLQLAALVDDSVLVSRGLSREPWIPPAVIQEKGSNKEIGESEFQFEAFDEVCCGLSHKRPEQSPESIDSAQKNNVQLGTKYRGQQQFYSPSMQASLWMPAVICKGNTESSPNMGDASSEGEESPCPSRLKEKSDHKWMCPMLFEWPKIKKMEMFGADDLDSRAIFILLAPSKACKDAEPAMVVYLWVGCNLVLDKERIQMNSSRGRSETREIDWEQIGRDFLEQMDLQGDIPIRVVRDREEPDEFWDNFING
eukprot:Gb_00349 [translate_table: standard]